MQNKIRIKNILIFELKSWLGRTFFNKKPLINEGKNYLNMGCADNVRPGFINADFFQFKFWKKDFKKLDWQLDLRFPLNCESNVFDGIHFEHTLEHLYPNEAQNILKELYRVLKVGGLIRITVPDLEKYVKFYNSELNENEKAEFQKRFQNGCEAISSLTQNHSHHSTWDFKSLKNFMTNVGFKNIQKISFANSQNPKLHLDRKEREWETLYVEAEK